ncbi:8-oxo-dGTP diphosphatase [Actinokineospora alba]|uniref:8-oxo-dGTP diphosphatase n=1 Tax=Actinokineospora alba TaxID=504798 RepID=A0A1H0I020_9PSEU|nr:NUDIX hydrolase [Actinokineospora alba]TDP64669.1 8-oxo-dGTP diphosphatase [Actinokineospora alba]SDI84480.1 8-oxo-dGTP diphosphatase [Actinokineospora alba]SDO24755.1 8-oxo-dGTP diphosphatase [Actinokineospora alba]
MKPILAAGAVLWRRAAEVEIAVVHRPRYGDWTLPKGKLDDGESRYAAAVREVAEETGFRCALGRSLGLVSYAVDGVPKSVDYFAARVVDGEFTVNDEVDKLEWLTPTAAAARLTYDHDRAVLATFCEHGPETTTLLLVRHGHAGRKDKWPGPDDERPLSKTGRVEAKALAKLIPLFGPDRVHSAPKTRCVQTVQRVAERLRVEVRMEPRLVESAPLDKAMGRLQEIVSESGTAVVCSQGGVIPDLVRGLAEDSSVDVGEAHSRKGSMWVLSFVGERMVGALYIRQATNT